MISFLEAQKLLNIDEGIVILNFSMTEYILFRVNQLLFAAMAEDTPINHDTEILFNIDKLIYANFLSSNNNPKLKYKLAFANHAFCEDFVQVNFNPGLFCPGLETEFLKDEPQYEEKKNAYLVKRVVRLVDFAAASNLKDLDTYLDLILEVKKLMPQELFDSVMYKLVNSGTPEQKLNEIYAALERKEKEQNQRKHLD